MWTQSKNLCNLVEATINGQQEDNLSSLEKVLKFHRSDFAALLKQPVMNVFFTLFFRLLLMFLVFRPKMLMTEICCLNLSKNLSFSLEGRRQLPWINLL